MKYLIIKNNDEIIEKIELGRPAFKSIEVEAEYMKRMYAKDKIIKEWDAQNKLEWNHQNETFDVKKEIPGGMEAFVVACIEYEMSLKYDIEEV